MVRRVKIAVTTTKSPGKQKGKARVHIRRNASNNSLKPKTRIAVKEGFNDVLTTNEKAVQLTYTR